MCANFSEKVNIKSAIAYKRVIICYNGNYRPIYQRSLDIYEIGIKYEQYDPLDKYGFHAYQFLDDAIDPTKNYSDYPYPNERMRDIRIVKVKLEKITFIGLDGTYHNSYDDKFAKLAPPIYVARFQTILKEVSI